MIYPDIDPIVQDLVRGRYTQLGHLYWHLRSCRPWDRAAQRRWYRRIQVVKQRLLEGGVPQIEVHLWCRYFRDPRNLKARETINRYYGEDIANNTVNLGFWPVSSDREKCLKAKSKTTRFKALQSVNNVYYVKYNNE